MYSVQCAYKKFHPQINQVLVIHNNPRILKRIDQEVHVLTKR